VNITINSIGTELSRDDRQKLFSDFGHMHPEGQLKLREQEVRNLMWLSECIAQDQKYRIVDGVISIF